MRIYRTTRSWIVSSPGVYGPIRSGGDCTARSIRDPVLTEEAEVAVQPRSAPPLPPETATMARPRQVAPHLLVHPVSDVREAARRVTTRKVLHPTAQDGIDLRNHLCHWPRAMTPKDCLERSGVHGLRGECARGHEPPSVAATQSGVTRGNKMGAHRRHPLNTDEQPRSPYFLGNQSIPTILQRSGKP